MKIYVSGKITGLPVDEARALFQSAEDYLKSKYKDFDIQAINPFKIENARAWAMFNAPEGEFTLHEVWVEFMKEDLAALMHCDGIFMLLNWESSKGARCEHAIAREMGLTVEYQQ